VSASSEDVENDNESPDEENPNNDGIRVDPKIPVTLPFPDMSLLTPAAVNEPVVLIVGNTIIGTINDIQKRLGLFSTHHDEEGSKEQDFCLDVEVSRESDPTTLVLLRTSELEGGVSVLKLELPGEVAGDGANVCRLKVRGSRVDEVLLKKS
jgi:hypothetical protein